MNWIMLPAFNEERTIANVIESAHDVLLKAGLDHAFIVCNDGSTDRTWAEILRVQRGFTVHYLQHRSNQGVAQAFRTLFSYGAHVSHDFSADDVFIMMEADRTSDPSLLSRMIPLIRDGYDVVSASRRQKGGGYCHFPLRRFFLSWSVNVMLKLFFPMEGARDYTIFYRAYSGRILKQWWHGYPQDKRIELSTFAANAEILVKFRPFSPSVTEIPFLYRYDYKRGKSKLKVIPTIYDYLIKMGVLVRRLSKHTPPVAPLATEARQQEPRGIR